MMTKYFQFLIAQESNVLESGQLHPFLQRFSHFEIRVRKSSTCACLYEGHVGDTNNFETSVVGRFQIGFAAKGGIYVHVSSKSKYKYKNSTKSSSLFLFFFFEEMIF